MDDDQDKISTAHVHHIFNANDGDREVSKESESESGSTTDPVVLPVDTDQLIGTQAIDMIMNKPEFSFLIRYYSLLYQSLIPNCKLTINTLRHYISISDSVEQYIVGAASRRDCCQRLVNFLLTRLYSEKNFKEFCAHLSIISVIPSLPGKLNTEFGIYCNRECNIPVKTDPCHAIKHNLHNTSAVSINNKFDASSGAPQYCVVRDEEAPDERAVKCSINGHRKRCPASNEVITSEVDESVTLSSNGDTMDLSFLLCSSDWALIEEHFKSFCGAIPLNYRLNIAKLKTMPRLLKDKGEQLSKLISSSSADDKKINEKIIAYLVAKLCYNDSSVSLADDSTDTATGTQQIKCVSTATVNCAPQRSSATPVLKLRSIKCSQQKVSSHPRISATTVVNTSSISVVPTSCVTESLTTSGGTCTVSSISRQDISTITTFPGFTELKAHYHTILQLMPNDYEPTLEKLKNFISDEQICNILSSNGSAIANKIMLDCAIEQISCGEELLDLCDQLDNISASHDLKIVVNKIRFGIQRSIQSPVSLGVTSNTQSLLSTNQQYHSLPSSFNSPFYQMMLSHLALDPDSKVVAVLKKNYARLCCCLPQDYMKTINKLKEFVRTSGDLSNFANLPTADLINERIIGLLMTAIRSDVEALHFCDVLQSLVDSESSTADVESLRDEILEALISSPKPVLPTAQTISTVSQYFTRSTAISHTSSIPSVQPTNNTGNVTQLPQSQQGLLQFPPTSTMSASVSVTATQITSTSPSSTSESTPSVNLPLSLHSSKQGLSARLRYQERRQQKGCIYLKPPALPSTFIPRQSLLEEITTKLLQATNDPNEYEITLAITGPGGFGKTTTVISLCHDPDVKKQFTDGFIFIKLGPEAINSSMQLRAIYQHLTGEKCDINYVEQTVSQLMNDLYRNVLVIIDDVWDVKDAKPLVKTFSSCKIILTTRMNDIEQYISSKRSVSIVPMSPSEAISLLTKNIIDDSQLSQEDKRSLNEIAQDVHLWPLLLSLIRGQLLLYLRKRHLSNGKAIQNVKEKLIHKGLTAFDKNNIGNTRDLAVKACIEATLELLTKSLLDKIKTLILFNGIGTATQEAVLHCIWSTSKQEAENTIESLWAHGLIEFTEVPISPNNNSQRYVEVHVTISQYINEHMDTNETYNLIGGGFQIGIAVSKGLTLAFQEAYGVHDPFSLSVIDFLKYKQSELENVMLPMFLKMINRQTVGEPHALLLTLQLIKDALMASPYTINLLSILDKQINSLMDNLRQIINDASKLCRKLNGIQLNLCAKNYKKLIQTLEEFMKDYPLCKVAQRAFAMTKENILPYCEGEQLHHMTLWCESFQTKTSDYHYITTLMIPCIKLYIKLHKQISSSLLNGSPDTESTYRDIMNGKYGEEEASVRTKWLINIQKVAPYYLPTMQLEASRK